MKGLVICFIVLICSIFFAVGADVDKNPKIICPDVVENGANDTDNYIIISIPPRDKGITTVNATLAFQKDIGDKQRKEPLELVEDLLKTVADAKQGKRMKFKINFQPDNRPTVELVVVNHYIVICNTTTSATVPTGFRYTYSKAIQFPSGFFHLSHEIPKHD